MPAQAVSPLCIEKRSHRLLDNFGIDRTTHKHTQNAIHYKASLLLALSAQVSLEQSIAVITECRFLWLSERHGTQTRYQGRPTGGSRSAGRGTCTAADGRTVSNVADGCRSTDLGSTDREGVGCVAVTCCPT